jgi:hypothetical protein
LIENQKFEQRFIKRLARVGTGSGLGISFSAFLLVNNFTIQMIGMLISVTGFYLFKLIRQTKEREDKCQSCPDYQSNKICYGLQLEAGAMRKYSDYASELLQKDLKDVYIKRLQNDN